MRDGCLWQAGAGWRKGGDRRRSSVASVGAGPAMGDEKSLTPLAQASPGLRDAPVALRGRPEEDDEGHRQGFYPWDQERLGLVDPLDRVSLNDLEIPFITAVGVQPKLATAHAKCITHSLCLVNHALGAHRPSGSPNTPNPLFLALKLWYTLSGRTNEPDGEVQVGRTLGHDHNSPMTHGLHRKHGDTSSGGITGSNGRDKVFQGRISVPAPRGVTVAARGLLAEPRAPGQ